MANRRMFSLDVVNTDNFLEMPTSTQALYFHLGMRADDDGFVSSPKRIATLIGAKQNDLKLLVDKGLVIVFENGIMVIRHWRQNNYLRCDRYTKSVHTEEMQQLSLENGVYTLCVTDGIPKDTPSVATDKIRIDKNRLDKNKNNICSDSDKSSPSTKTEKFIPPTAEEVQNYCKERNNAIDAQSFIDFYESKGWMIGKNKMKNWKAAVRTWERNNKQTVPEDNLGQRPNYKHDFDIILPSSPDDPFK